MKIARPKIHIIANCANRKRVPSTKELSSISPQSDLIKRARFWWENLNSPPAENQVNGESFRKNQDKIKAGELYIGSYWSTIRQLPVKARLSGFDSDLWVISAGYGLISSSDDIYSYSATFTPGDKNSVTDSGCDIKKRDERLKEWWELISDFQLPQSPNPRKLRRFFRENSGDYFLIVASGSYLSAVEKDLLEGIKFLSSPENLIIVTSRSFANENLQMNVIPADARLQCNGDCAELCERHLLPRGIRGTISASLACKIIERAKKNGFNAPSVKQYVQAVIEKSPSLVNFNRTRIDDAVVFEFINQELTKSPSASCTSLLRKMRESGSACEQKRFREIYQSTKRSAL